MERKPTRFFPIFRYDSGMTNPPTELTGKTAFVTGASSGIGRAIATALGRQGVQVVLCARRLERLEAVAESIQKAGGPEAAIVTADFFDVVEIECAIAEGAGQAGGKLDILINSAGIGRQAKLVDGNTQDWREMLNLNVLALAVATREALKFFPEDTGGHVVNLGSMSGHRVPGRGGFYAATKFAVRAMTEGLRQELRLMENPTRVSSISPGFVDTELLDDYFKAGTDGAAKYEAIGYPILQPEEIADVVLAQLKMPATAEITDVLIRPTAQGV
ncbi:MAG: SDR family NAD(P)-dependent oxidoreductase [Verrucomicrobiales bacterium]|nr:SDR family NAD(P)-dependent oxidoreductase [Verrucomicrobiales bacterium]